MSMRILIITPLYPPDIAPLALYVKELARRLKEETTVTILAYTHIPELISGVRIAAIPKYSILPVRLFLFFKALLREAKTADILFIQNGASVELPCAFFMLFSRKKCIVHLVDAGALRIAEKRPLLKKILTVLLRNSNKIMVSGETKLISKFAQKTMCVPTPLVHPEILPFSQYPEEEMRSYENSWNVHTQKLIKTFYEITH